MDSVASAFADLALDLNARCCDENSAPIVHASSANKYFERAARINPSLKAWTDLNLKDDHNSLALPNIARGQSHRRLLAGSTPMPAPPGPIASHFGGPPTSKLRVPADERNRVRRTENSAPVTAPEPARPKPKTDVQEPVRRAQPPAKSLTSSRWASPGLATNVGDLRISPAFAAHASTPTTQASGPSYANVDPVTGPFGRAIRPTVFRERPKAPALPVPSTAQRVAATVSAAPAASTTNVIPKEPAIKSITNGTAKPVEIPAANGIPKVTATTPLLRTRTAPPVPFLAASANASTVVAATPSTGSASNLLSVAGSFSPLAHSPNSMTFSQSSTESVLFRPASLDRELDGAKYEAHSKTLYVEYPYAYGALTVCQDHAVPANERKPGVRYVMISSFMA